MSIITEKTDYVNGNAIDAEVINDVVETAINANNVATNIGSNVDISEIGNVGTPSVSITTEGHLKFSALKGETGAKGDKGDKGDTGNNGLDGSSTIIKAFKNYDAGTTYKNNKDELDFVQYSGSTYAPLSTEGIVNILPTNGSYWQLIASAGASAGGNVASTNNDTLDTNVSYSFKPTNNPTTASGALNGIWQPISIPDPSVYVLKNQGTSNSSKVVMTNENGFIQDTFRSISDSVSSSTDLASCKAVYDYTYSQNDIDSKNTATLSSANTYTDKQSMELGYYDTMVENSDGTYTITRQTGYHNISNDLIEHGYYQTTQGGYGEYGADTGIHNLPIVSEQKSFINNLLIVRDTSEVYAGSIGIAITRAGGCWINLGDNYTTKEKYVEYLSQNNIYIQYKLATATTEKVEKNHYARYNERFILEHNKSEADKSSNLFNPPDVSSTTVNGITFSVSNGVCSINGTSTGGSFNSIGSITLPAGTYHQKRNILSGTYNAVDYNFAFGIVLDGIVEIGKYDYTFTITEPKTFQIVVWWHDIGVVVFNSLKLRMMLNSGSVALPYQPYEGKVVHEKGIKTINGNSIVGGGNVGITEGLFTLIGENIDELTITENGTYLITSTYYDKIYVSVTSEIEVYGSALVSIMNIQGSGRTYVAVNGVKVFVDDKECHYAYYKWFDERL